MTAGTGATGRHADCEMDERRIHGADEEDHMNTLTIAALGGTAAAVAISGCAAFNRTRPSDMTIPEHEAAARAEAKEAEEAARRATVVGRGAESERYSAKRHRDLAQEHAAAAEHRRQEVATTCSGVTAPASLSSMPLTSVEPIWEAEVPPARRHPRGYYPERLRGARIAVAPAGIAPAAAVPAVECEAARISSGLAAAASQSPFAVRTAGTIVRVADARLVIEIRGGNRSDAEEILKRAEMLAVASSGNAPR